jgi:hypothetical protein
MITYNRLNQYCETNDIRTKYEIGINNSDLGKYIDSFRVQVPSSAPSLECSDCPKHVKRINQLERDKMQHKSVDKSHRERIVRLEKMIENLGMSLSNANSISNAHAQKVKNRRLRKEGQSINTLKRKTQSPVRQCVSELGGNSPVMGNEESSEFVRSVSASAGVASTGVMRVQRDDVGRSISMFNSSNDMNSLSINISNNQNSNSRNGTM